MDLYKGFEDYLQFISNKKQPSSLRRYRYDIEHFITWLASERKEATLIDRPSQEEISLYYSYLYKGGTYSPNTIRRLLSVLKQWLHFLNEDELVHCVKEFIKQTKLNEQIDVPILTKEQINHIFKTIHSFRGLTEHQKKYRHLIQDRNEAIFRLILLNGLSIQEITTLTTKNIHFSSNEIELISRKEKKRVKIISSEDRKKMYDYYMTINEAIRPNRYDPVPFFLAFDYQRGTYRWDEENNIPKQLTEVSIQKMIRQEVVRAHIPYKLNAQKMRKYYIVQQLIHGIGKERLKEELALETTQPLDKLEDYANQWIKQKITS